MRLTDLENKKILLVGYGTEGKATELFLKDVFPNINITIADKSMGEDYLAKQSEFDLAIKSPGVQKSLLTIPYTTATNLFFQNVKGTTIGITGSKGKSTTSSLIYTILKQADKKVHLVGNITHKEDKIGSPMLSELLVSNTPEDVWVVELSSFMLDDIVYSPHVSVFTSFFPEHMDYHKTVENYFEAKSHIIEQATANDFFVYNPHSPELQSLANISKAKSIPFISQLPFDEKDIPLVGEHNKENVRAAVTVAQILEIPTEIIHTAVTNFHSLPHRLENVGTFKDVTFYDDAISTTPQSTIEAIKALPTIGTMFLGGQDRGYNFFELAQVIADADIENIVLFPESGEKIFNEISKVSTKQYNVLRTKSMEEAIAFAYKNTPRNTICLLSTASPSYTVWKNFEEKGNLFKKYARELANK
ncbi:MAG TPA: UDP-N-acetylmuramoyl-L-alanine--D-glutamate ligase [Patescibacteria group bacterium]